MVTVETKALGRKQPLAPAWSIPAPESVREDGSISLRDLIEAVVRGEVDAFEERRQARVFLRALSAEEIGESALRGRVDMGGQEDTGAPADADAAVETALQAFEDGMYLVLVDEVEQRDLNATVFVTDETRLMFLRLTFLAGA